MKTQANLSLTLYFFRELVKTTELNWTITQVCLLQTNAFQEYHHLILKENY